MKYLFYFTIFLTIFSCQKNNSSNEAPKKLIIGFVPSEESERMVKNLQPVVNYISKKTKLPTKIYKGSDYTAIIEAMRSQKLDIAVFGPFSYILASEKAKVEPLVVPASRQGKVASYKSLIITNINSGINSIEDVIKTKKKYTLSFSDPASTSGHLVPRGQLISMGIKPELHFKNILFSGNHTATIFALASGKIDVAGCSHTVFNKMIERGMLDKNKVKILWESDNLPVDLVTVRKDFPQDLKKILQDAYVKMADEAPETAKYFYEEWNDSTLVYIPAKDSMYKEIRRLSNFVNNDLN